MEKFPSIDNVRCEIMKKRFLKNPWFIGMSIALFFFILGLIFYKGNIQTKGDYSPGVVEGDYQIGDDIARDKIEGNYIGGDNISGDKVEIENVTIYADPETAPYVRFAQKVKIVKQKPDLDIIIESIRNAFQGDSINGEKIISRIQSLPDNVKSQFINIFYMTSLEIKLENIGESLARDIKVVYQNEIIYQVESLGSKEKSSNSVVIHNLHIALKGWEGHEEEFIQYRKSPELWNGLIDQSISIVDRGGIIGNALEDHYKSGGQENISIDIQWKDLHDKEYKHNAITKLYWDGKEDKLTLWEYQLNH
jgi:hypothetical protein